MELLSSFPVTPKPHAAVALSSARKRRAPPATKLELHGKKKRRALPCFPAKLAESSNLDQVDNSSNVIGTPRPSAAVSPTSPICPPAPKRIRGGVSGSGLLLSRGIVRRDPALVRKAIAAGADVNGPLQVGGPPVLLYAIETRCSNEILRILIEGGAEPNAVDSEGSTALHLLAKGFATGAAKGFATGVEGIVNRKVLSPILSLKSLIDNAVSPDRSMKQLTSKSISKNRAEDKVEERAAATKGKAGGRVEKQAAATKDKPAVTVSTTPTTTTKGQTNTTTANNKIADKSYYYDAVSLLIKHGANKTISDLTDRVPEDYCPDLFVAF